MEPPAPETQTEGLSQEKVNEIAAKARSEGQAKAREELLASLGVTDADEAATVIAAHKAAELAKMSDAERDRTIAAAEREAAERDRREVAEMLLHGKASRKLRQAGLDESLTERLAPTLRLPLDATDDDIAAAVEALKAETPTLFGTEKVPPAPGGVRADGRNGPPAGSGSIDEAQQGREMFKQWKQRNTVQTRPAPE